MPIGVALDALTVDAFLNPTGVIPRIGLLAFNHEAADDKLADPTDAAWWGKPFKFSLWNMLGTYASQVEKAGSTGADFDFDEDIARGDAIAIRTRGQPSVEADLREIREAGWHKCAPWILPRSGAAGDKPGKWPVKNVACVKAPMPRLVDDIVKKHPQRSWFGAGFPWWIIVVVVAISRRKR
jgi:hypothetical protein